MNKNWTLIILIQLTNIIALQAQGFYDTNLKLIKNSNGVSISEFFEKKYSQNILYEVYQGNDCKECSGYSVVFKKYSTEPLFIIGTPPKKDKHLSKCIASYNVFRTYADSFDSDLKLLVSDKVGPEVLKSLFGNQYKETIDYVEGSELKIWNYNKFGGAMSFDLIFENQVLTGYKRYN